MGSKKLLKDDRVRALREAINHIEAAIAQVEAGEADSATYQMNLDEASAELRIAR